MNDDEKELHITPLFVFHRLEKHEDTCAKRWWAVMCGVIAQLMILLAELITHAH